MINYATLKSVLVKVVIFSLLLSMFYAIQPPAQAASWSQMKDTMSRLKEQVNSNHIFELTLPAGNFDATGGEDEILITFPAGFVPNASWVVGDFEVEDGAYNILSVDASTVPAHSCAGVTADDISVTVDTDGLVFGFKACTGGTFAEITGTIKIEIFGGETVLGAGLLQNPTLGTYSIGIAMTDEGSANTNTGSLQVPIVDDDTVNITADVQPTLVFDLDTTLALAWSDSSATYDIHLGTLTTSTVTTSGNGSVEVLWIELSSNATGGTVVTVTNTDTTTGLQSTSVPTDIIADAMADNTTLSAGTEGYGICVYTTLTNFDTSDIGDNYDGTSGNGCTYADFQVSQPPSSASTADTILNRPTPIDGGKAAVLYRAAIATTTKAHNDYADAHRYIATGTF